jgi:methylated-DNA-[protein]-cysteine S-methyltransferase
VDPEHSAWLDSPVGTITVVAGDAFVHRVRFDREDGTPAPPGSLAAMAAAELTEYFAGGRHEFGLTPDWQRLDAVAARVLQTLVRIAPYGRTVSYGELTTAAGLSISESRAVGVVLNGNPWPVVVPCHRVVMTDGSLGGFGSGRWRKEELLRLEGVLPSTLFD